MARGFVEGPASEERAEALERGGETLQPPRRMRKALYGSTPEHPQRHFIGWLDEVDPEELFASGRAWGLSVVIREE
jgi:hypothetical protein